MSSAPVYNERRKSPWAERALLPHYSNCSPFPSSSSSSSSSSRPVCSNPNYNRNCWAARRPVMIRSLIKGIVAVTILTAFVFLSHVNNTPTPPDVDAHGGVEFAVSAVKSRSLLLRSVNFLMGSPQLHGSKREPLVRYNLNSEVKRSSNSMQLDTADIEAGSRSLSLRFVDDFGFVDNATDATTGDATTGGATTGSPTNGGGASTNSTGETCDDVPNTNATFTMADQCNFVEDNCVPGGLFDWLGYYYCDIPSSMHIPALVGYGIVVVVLFWLLGAAAEDYFCPALTVISEAMNLSPDLAGITILALGNGSPDVFSMFAATQSGAFVIALGEVIGAGTFVTTVVVGVVTLSCVCVVDKLPILRDTLFYLVALALVSLLVIDDELSLFESLPLLVYYVLYVSFSVVVQCVNRRREEGEKALEMAETDHLLHEAEAEDMPWADIDGPSGGDAQNEEGHLPLREGLIKLQVMAEHEEKDLELGRNAGSTVEFGDGHPWMLLDAKYEEKDIRRQQHALGEDGQGLYEPIGTMGGSTDGSANVSLTQRMHPNYLAGRVRYHYNEIYWYALECIAWSEKSIFDKVQYIVFMPFIFAFNMTIPWAEDWNKPLAVCQPTFGLLFGLIATQTFTYTLVGIPIVVPVFLLGIAISFVVGMTTHYHAPPDRRWPYVAAGFFMSILWIFVIANELVGLLQTWGLILDISQGVLGLTVLAWGNSVGDMVSNCIVARQGFPGMAMAACFGGPLFNLLLGIGFSVSYWTILHFPEPLPVQLTSNIVLAIPFLVLSLVSTLLVVPLNGYQFPKWLAIWLFIVYVGFTAVGLAAEAGWIAVYIPTFKIPFL
eukprot:TRINITY_DN6516_c0_g3_i1.p1 TRINITY_DN6516_c0_g3~~TRINITY_DN6516_c0_g3_i1.p1  ORF type:complete len:834 (+),score=200.63 TRINITY_DN6516_c0_g3_i1:540-3041(+)